MRGKGLLFWISLILVFVLSGETYDPGTYESGTPQYWLDLSVFGIRRSYLLHVPRGYDWTRPLPLIVALHGGFGTARAMEEETGFSEIADREKFFVAYPNGFGMFGRLQHWNAGHCCGFAMEWGIDDIGFVSRVIDQVRTQVQVDPSRIYMVGYSNGGMLAYLFAARNPDTLSAVAAISATIGSRSSPEKPEMRIGRPPAPLPVIAFHGLTDRTVPYIGGSLDSPYGYVSVRESMRLWVEGNRCTAEPDEEEMMSGRVIKRTWCRGERRREVVLFTLKEWGHLLPGAHSLRSLPEGDPLRGLHAMEIIWEFFRAHAKPPA